ncbi:hypothetical protein IFM89_010698 [Coptis chinensis]|uniref:Ubiquitin-like domain-containing protein n=1 Tax=Coptis chinensis TaxID=261450 RepID=A0A835M563_9MAGN|nr:hypothetical protein IFM89_010698 [Coptis chinensis]
MSEESERKPSLTGQSRKVHLTLKAQDQIEVKFSVKRTVPLQKLMDAYCLERSVEANSFRFLVDGQRLKGHRTADDVLLFIHIYFLLSHVSFYYDRSVLNP